MLDAAGPSASGVANLWWGMFIYFGIVLVLVTLLWIHVAYIRPRRRPSPAAESNAAGNRWIIGGGVLLPLVSVTVLLLFGLPLGHRMAAPTDAALTIEVTGHQWWWQVRYPNAAVETANRVVIPAGVPVRLELTSGDVIHSFWVPRLGGKMDMIPGHINALRLQADAPGRYLGQCSEFCGAQHARMRLVVDALPPDDFAAWLERRRAARVPRPAASTLSLFDAHCGDCHRVAGLSRGGGGPDLTDVASRPTLGAGVLDASVPGSILHWLRDHQSLKPDNRMPAGLIEPAELAAIADWLEELEP